MNPCFEGLVVFFPALPMCHGLLPSAGDQTRQVTDGDTQTPQNSNRSQRLPRAFSPSSELAHSVLLFSSFLLSISIEKQKDNQQHHFQKTLGGGGGGGKKRAVPKQKKGEHAWGIPGRGQVGREHRGSPGPSSCRVPPEHTAQDHPPLPWHCSNSAGGEHVQAHPLAPGTEGQTRLVPLAQAPGGFTPSPRSRAVGGSGIPGRARPGAPDPPSLGPRPPRSAGPGPAPPATRKGCGRSPPLPALPHGSRGSRRGAQRPHRPSDTGAVPCPVPLSPCKVNTAFPSAQGYWNGSCSCSCSAPKQIQFLLSPNPPQPQIIIAVHPQTFRIFIWSSSGFTELACAAALRYSSAIQNTHEAHWFLYQKQCFLVFCFLISVNKYPSVNILKSLLQSSQKEYRPHSH